MNKTYKVEGRASKGSNRLKSNSSMHRPRTKNQSRSRRNLIAKMAGQANMTTAENMVGRQSIGYGALASSNTDGSSATALGPDSSRAPAALGTTEAKQNQPPLNNLANLPAPSQEQPLMRLGQLDISQFEIDHRSGDGMFNREFTAGASSKEKSMGSCKNSGPPNSAKRLGFLQKVENTNKRVADRSNAEAIKPSANGQGQLEKLNETTGNMALGLSPVQSLSRGSQSPGSKKSQKLAKHGPVLSSKPSCPLKPEAQTYPTPALPPSRVLNQKSPPPCMQQSVPDPAKLSAKSILQSKLAQHQKSLMKS